MSCVVWQCPCLCNPMDAFLFSSKARTCHAIHTFNSSAWKTRPVHVPHDFQKHHVLPLSPLPGGHLPRDLVWTGPTYKGRGVYEYNWRDKRWYRLHYSWTRPMGVHFADRSTTCHPFFNGFVHLYGYVCTEYPYGVPNLPIMYPYRTRLAIFTHFLLKYGYMRTEYTHIVPNVPILYSYRSVSMVSWSAWRTWPPSNQVMDSTACFARNSRFAPRSPLSTID